MRKLLLSVVALPLVLRAGIEISSDHTDALYRCGETATFTVKVMDGDALMKTGSVSVVLDTFGTNILSRRTVRLDVTNGFAVAGTRSDPGFLRLTVHGAGGTATWGVGYEPDRIRPVTPVPDDFDAFWAAARQRLAREVPLDAQMTKVPERSTAAFDFYRISFATFGRRVHGYMSVPTDKARAPYPVNLQVAAAGFGGWTNDMSGSRDHISVFFSVYPFEPDWKWKELGLKSFYDKMNGEACAKYPCGGYATSGAGNSREECFFYPVILGIDRAIDWVAARSDVDPSRFVYQGTSQGGGMGLILTGLNKHITRAAFFVPAITDTLAGLAGRQSGWPQPMENQRTAAAKATAAKVMPYFDGASFATRITCPVRFAIGFADTVCAPHCTWAAYNAVASKDKRLLYGIGMGHGCRGEFYGALGKWLRGADAAEPVTVTLTFDDNRKEWAKTVPDLLDKYGWKGVFNIVASEVRKKGGLSWDDVRGIRAAGHEVANHSLTHANMGKLLREGRTNEVVREVRESRDIFVRELGCCPDWYCYAGNWGDAFCHQVVEEAGMRSLEQKRPNLGYLTPPCTDKGTYVMLLNARKPVDLMIHGISRGCGWLPFESVGQFEAFLQELKALENEGFVRVLPYSEAHRRPLKFLLMSDAHVESDFVQSHGLTKGEPVYTMWKPGNHAALVETFRFVNENPFCRDVDFALFLGDQINTGYTKNRTDREAEMENYRRTLETLDVHAKTKGNADDFDFVARPWTVRENLGKGDHPYDVRPEPPASRVVAIQGNHDTGVDTFYRDCAFTAGDVRFITFFASYVGLPPPPGKLFHSTAKISDETIAFVAQEMEKAAVNPQIRHIVLCSHWAVAPVGKDFVHPVIGPCPQNGGNDNRRRLLELAEKYGCDLFLNGHEHNARYPVGKAGPMADINCGSLTGNPGQGEGAFAIVEIRPDKAVITVFARADATEREGKVVVTARPRKLFVREIPLRPIRKTTGKRFERK